MFKIGEFSRLAQLSVSALRYYSDCGLLQPARIDTFTGYRYYSIEQLPQLYRILALRDLGLSLEQIAHVLENDLSAEQIRGMLRLKQAELQQRLAEEQARLNRVSAYLRRIEQEDMMSGYDVVIKEVPAQLVAGLRQIVPNYSAIGSLYSELYAHLGRHGAGGMNGAVYHDEEYKEHNPDVEAVVFLKEPAPETDRIKVYELPACTVASLIHHGSPEGYTAAYGALMTWIAGSGYRICGPNRELYLRWEEDPQQNVTEIQFPVTR